MKGNFKTHLLVFLFEKVIRQLPELTSEGHAEGVVDLRSPGWSEAQPWVLNVNRRPALKERQEGSERVSSKVGISPGVGLLRSS